MLKLSTRDFHRSVTTVGYCAASNDGHLHLVNSLAAFEMDQIYPYCRPGRAYSVAAIVSIEHRRLPTGQWRPSWQNEFNPDIYTSGQLGILPGKESNNRHYYNFHHAICSIAPIGPAEYELEMSKIRSVGSVEFVSGSGTLYWSPIGFIKHHNLPDDYPISPEMRWHNEPTASILDGVLI